MGDFKVDTTIRNSDTNELIGGQVKEIFDEFGSQCYNQGYDTGSRIGFKKGLLIGASVVLAGVATYVTIKNLRKSDTKIKQAKNLEKYLKNEEKKKKSA